MRRGGNGTLLERCGADSVVYRRSTTRSSAPQEDDNERIGRTLKEWDSFSSRFPPRPCSASRTSRYALTSLMYLVELLALCRAIADAEGIKHQRSFFSSISRRTQRRGSPVDTDDYISTLLRTTPPLQPVLPSLKFFQSQ